MPVSILRYIITIGLFACLQIAFAQNDVAVEVVVDNATPSTNELVYATIFIHNEGATPRTDLMVELRMSPALFFVDLIGSAQFDLNELRWSIAELDIDQSDSIRVAIQPNYGGIHSLTAELMAADGEDWDSKPGNGRIAEDDQDDDCISVPVSVDCGQALVLSAPQGFEDYIWYRDGEILVNSTSDTIHPIRSGAYSFEIGGQSCVSGNCCPVIVDRAGCDSDMALKLQALPLEDGEIYQPISVKLFNQGNGPVTRVDYYVTTSAAMRLKPGANDWIMAGSQMSTSWEGILQPGDSTEVIFEIQALSGFDPVAYSMFSEISAFYAGADKLDDADSTPDNDPGNDALVDNAIDLPRTQDEDDSDVASLTDCPAIVVSGNEPVCAGESLSLVASGSNETTYEWSGDVVFSCLTCSTVEFIVNGPTTIKLKTTEINGCSLEQEIRVETKSCLENLLLVSSPYEAGNICFDVNTGQDLVWCQKALPIGINVSDDLSTGRACITAATTGEWGGLFTTCVELCESGNCNEVNVKILGLPRLDEVSAIGGEEVCIGDALQMDVQPIDVNVSTAANGLALKPVGSNCFLVEEPAGSYDDTEFTIVHKYALADTTVLDTTTISVPGKQICDLDVLQRDTFYLTATANGQRTTGDETICLVGARSELATLSYTFGGEAVAAPSQGCNPYKSAKYSLQALPRGWNQDAAWKIDRYLAGGRTVISNFYASSLNDVLAKIEAADPGAKASITDDGRVLEVSNYTKEPGALRLTYLASASRVSERPLLVNGYAGWSFEIPEGIAVGTYELAAKDEQGCIDVATVIVTEGTTVNETRDTVEILVEVGEPVMACDLQGMTINNGEWASAGNSCFMFMTKEVKENDYHTFRFEGNNEIRERTYIINTYKRNCGVLLVESTLTINSSRCAGEYFSLGLTRPDLTVQSSKGRVISASQVTGSRPGASYDLNALTNFGLTDNYAVESWTGVSRTQGLEGNISEIISQLRRSGVDVYINWDSRQLIAAGEGIGELILKNLDQRSEVRLASSGSSIETYGRFYGNRGTNSLSVSSSFCSARMRAEVECQVIVWGGGGIFFLTTGEPTEMRFDELDLPESSYAWTIDESPSHVQATISTDGKGIVFTSDSAIDDVLTISSCDEKGNCKKAKVQLQVANDICQFEIWRPENARLATPPGDDELEYVLPAKFERGVTKLLLDGKEKIGGLVKRSVVTERTYAINEQDLQVVAIRSPFGKTIQVSGGRSNDALAQVFAEAETEKDGNMLVVRGGNEVGHVYTKDLNEIWRPLEPLTVKQEERYVVRIPAGGHDIEMFDKAGNCSDKIHIEVNRAELDIVNDQVEFGVGELVDWCLPEPKAGKTILSVENTCEAYSGEFASVSQTANCYTFEGFETGEEVVCLRRTYLDGSVDSFSIELIVKAPLQIGTVDDRDTVEFGQFKVLEVLRNDGLADEPRMVSLISEPFFGRAQVVGNSAIEYLHYGSDCAVDVFTYEVCQGTVCDSATVQVDVYCQDLLVYNGFSPNGDGVNDELTILGLGSYPDHEISLFNREGNLLITFREYANDWRGDISGRPLAAGTYFYVIELGDGESESGYIQLSR